MAEQTKIAWTDATFNPWIGCSRVHTGCKNCYAERIQGRFGVTWGLRGTRRKTSDTNWRKPLQWDRKAEREGRRMRVMCGSLMDLFEDWRDAVQDHHGEDLAGYQTIPDLRRDVFSLIDQTPNLTWIIPTKRPENVRRMWPTDDHIPGMEGIQSYLKNVHLLYSASDQETLDAGLPYLLACRDLVPVLGLSLEPLVGPVDLSRKLFGWDPITFRRGPAGYCDRPVKPDWVIVGGESGPHARPCDVAWIRSIVRQCHEAGVKCFVKQVHVNGRVSTDPAEWPEDIRVQQFPEVSQ